MAVLWRRVIIQEYKLERLKEVVDIESDWEAVDEAINRILFSDEIHRMLDDDGDDRGSEDDDDRSSTLRDRFQLPRCVLSVVTPPHT